LKLIVLIPVFCSLGLPAGGKDKGKNPYKDASNSQRQSKAVITTVKRYPDKAEQEAAFNDYNIPREQRHNYVAGYRVPISLGGSNAYANIEVLAKSQAKMKHKVEKALEKKLHQGEISESEAQFRILNWTSEPNAR
jgi:hypothetical protein